MGWTAAPQWRGKDPRQAPGGGPCCRGLSEPYCGQKRLAVRTVDHSLQSRGNIQQEASHSCNKVLYMLLQKHQTQRRTISCLSYSMSAGHFDSVSSFSTGGWEQQQHSHAARTVFASLTNSQTISHKLSINNAPIVKSQFGPFFFFFLQLMFILFLGLFCYLFHVLRQENNETSF